MANENTSNTQPPSVFEYYAAEVTNFHLSSDDGNATTKTGRAAENAQQASQSNLGQAVGAVGTAMGVFGEVTSLTTQLSEAALMPALAMLGMQGLACLPASSHMDPVMGIDVHFVMIPPSPSPVPMPHPYIAMIMDPKDWLSCAVMSVAAMAAPTPTELPDDATEEQAAAAADADAAANLAFNLGTMALGMAGLGATIKLGGFTPRTNTGAKNKAIPHFPMGASFAPMPVQKNAGHAQFGSLFLLADGEPFTGLMHLNNDCWDVGIIELLRKKASPKPMHLYMPTGFIMAIPSHNVLVNPIPTPINPIALGAKLFKAAFGKLKKKVADGLHGRVNKVTGPKSRMGNALHKAICIVTGHPVDVASGKLFTDEEDISLPGVIPFSWERTWYSDSNYKGPLGHGWHHSYDMGFAIDENNIAVFRMNDGRVASFELPLPGKFTFNRNEKLFLHLHPEGMFYYITDLEGLAYRFTDKIYSNEYSQTECQLIQSIANTNGYAIRFEYNRKGHLTKIIDSAARVLTVHNDFTGRITSILAPHPENKEKTFCISSYAYDEEDNMICHSDALGQKMAFEYLNHLLVKETWRNGQQWYFVYEGNSIGSRCIHTWGDGDLYNHKLTYLEGCTLVENSLGHVTTYYHKGGLVYRKTDAKGADWEYRHNQYNELEWETDPLGNQQAYAHDEWGNISTTTDPSGGFTHTEYYNPHFPYLPTEAMDAAGGRWKWEYDTEGNLIQGTNPLGAKTHYKYEDGLLIQITNGAEASTQLSYDRDQNLIQITTDDGAMTRYGYDALGNCTELINPNEVIQRRFYDLKGRTHRIDDFDGNVIHLEYDGLDNVVRYKDKQKEVQYTYRGLWKLTSRTEAGATVYFNYDTEEQLRKVVNEHGLPYRFELDPVGNVAEEIGFDNITRRYERNPAGWVTQVHRPAEKYTRYGYDACGRVTEVQYSDGQKESYAYRPDGNLISAVNESATVEFERDVMGNILKETVNGEWIASEFDNMGNRITITSSLGAHIHHLYNKIGDVLEMETNGWKAQYKHDKLGLEVERLLPGGISSQWQRDGIGRPVVQTIGHTAGVGTSLKKRKQYLWDVNDRLKQIKDEKGITRFEHDSWSNLAKTIYPNGEEQLRNPDAVGNLFTSEDRKDRKYAKGGQLKKANGWEYSYDEEGNLIQKKHLRGDRWTYEWNDAGMLIQVTRPDKGQLNFTYDALGRRLSKHFKNTFTKFVWDGNVPLHEWKEHASTGQKLSEIKVGKNGLVTWLFETDSFVPAGKIKGDKEFSIITDHLGTPSQMYREDGSLFWESELDSYGKVRIEKGEVGSCPFRYQGQYEDVETGLYYNRFRYFAVEEGIYVSQDPIRLDSGEPNLYVYVPDPNIWIDRIGLSIYSGKKKGRYSVYVLKKDGKVVYFGITKQSPKKREKQHRQDKKDFDEMYVIDSGLTRRQARNVEGSALHHANGTGLQNERRNDEQYYHSYNKPPGKGKKLIPKSDIDNKVANGTLVNN